MSEKVKEKESLIRSLCYLLKMVLKMTSNKKNTDCEQTFFTENLLCHSRKSTGVNNKINVG